MKYTIVPEDYPDTGKFPVIVLQISVSVSTADDEESGSRDLDMYSKWLTISLNDEVVLCHPSIDSVELTRENADFEFLCDDIIYSCKNGCPDISFAKFGDIYYNVDIHHYESSVSGSYNVKLIKLKS